MQNSLSLSANAHETLVSTKELAEQLHCATKTILNLARKCLPEKKIENGKPTFWNEKEATILLEEMKSSNTNQYNLARSVQGVSTSLTPSLRMIQAMEMFKAAADEELARLRAENVQLANFKTDIEKKIANAELVETPSENARNHLWQNIQKVGTAIGDYRQAWRLFWDMVKRDTSIDVKTRATNKGVKPMDYICNELNIEIFNKIFALSEKLKNDYCKE